MTGPLGLRPVVEDDRWRLHAWRSSERVRLVSIDDGAIPEDRHSAWFDGVLAERADQLHVVEWDGRPVGLVQIEGLDVAQQTSSWGCYLGDTDVPPGVGAALPLLGLGVGFREFGLRRMTAQVLGSNENMAKMHRRLRIPVEGTMVRHVRRTDGGEVDVTLYGVHRDDWPTIRDSALTLFPSHLRTDIATLTGAG